jgi:ethanolamine ammonia-lyase small subunit
MVEGSPPARREDRHDGPPSPSDRTRLVEAVRARTPARILLGHAGSSYSTATQLDLRQDHAAAADAVHTELDLVRDLGRDFVDRWGLFEVATRARSKTEYLLRPDLGRGLDDAAVESIGRCPLGPDLQVVLGDGLSAGAIAAQVPALLPLLETGAHRLGWRFGPPFFIRHCRVGVLNDIGEVLRPTVAVLLIGERPGLMTTESLSAYMAYRPRAGHTDAQRNVISNIHPRGSPPPDAAGRILRLAERMMRLELGGVSLKEVPPCADGPAPAVLPQSL